MQIVYGERFYLLENKFIRGVRWLSLSYPTFRNIMAPSEKKGQQPTKDRPLLGRPSNNLKIGIVGLPNVGKSSLFNVITSSAVSAENYPFCTIRSIGSSCRSS